MNKNLGLSRINKSVNFLDYKHAIINRVDIYDLIKNNLIDLDERQLFQKNFLMNLLDDHIKKKSDNTKNLTLLVSLELMLKLYIDKKYTFKNTYI